MSFEHFREKLLAKRRHFFAQVTHVEEDLLALTEDVEPEIEEEGQEENISRVLATLDDRGKAEIEAIDRALARIESDEYGECSECGGHIPPERHDAVPEAETCIQCAQRHESVRV